MQEFPGERREDPGVSLDEARTGPAWENRSGMSIVRALLVTLQGSMFGPSRFFRGMKRNDGFFYPLVYAMIFGSVSIVASAVWELTLAGARNPLLGQASSDEFLRMGPMLYGLTIILSPIVVTIMAFITSGVLHVALIILGGANQSFQTSFRVVCYSQGAAILNLVPYLGAFAGSIWNLVLLAIGLRESHPTPSWKAVLAVLAMLMTWLGVVLLLGVLVVATGLLSPP